MVNRAIRRQKERIGSVVSQVRIDNRKMTYIHTIQRIKDGSHKEKASKEMDGTLADWLTCLFVCLPPIAAVRGILTTWLLFIHLAGFI